MLPITPMPPPKEDTLNVGKDVPKELAIYGLQPKDFLPKGKTFDDLTPEERQTLINQYRFSPFKPGLYQQITGYSRSY